MTDLQKLIAFALKRKGLRNSEIALRFEVCTETIGNLFRARPVPEVAVPRDMSPSNIEKLTQLFMEGKYDADD